MRRLLQAGVVLAVIAVALLPLALRDAGSERRPHIIGIGAELMAQQAPPPNIDRSMFGDPRGPHLDYDEIARTAGRWPFYWTRAVYSGYGRRGFFGGGGSWAVDFPKSDQQFMIVLKRLVRLNGYDWENPVSLANPDLRKFPLIYMLEVGGMDMTEAEVEGLRGFMQAGGFVIVDDFWGLREWDVFEYNMRRVFPDRPIVDIGLDHPIYTAYYTIDHVEMTPAIGNTIQRTECWGCETQIKGMYDEDGRLMMMINFNTDLGDAWEWAESPQYPLDISTYAFEIGVNMIVYAMSH
ncbi:MAG: DUF4159 domain-containing protein [Acidobacteriota bacterium]|nr:DUF4159 domain-containing protein [Acidobacteriota bacterium]